MNRIPDLPNANSMPLSDIDLSDPRLYEFDAWRPYCKRLREEAPVHYITDSEFGPYWSITRFDDIVEVELNHEVFSSEPLITIGNHTEEFPLEMFIAMDPPKHRVQRSTAQKVVAPKNLAAMEKVIRSQVNVILDSLPIGEPFDWVQQVSISLTTYMLATIFGFPYEQRDKLPYWSDLAAGAPELSGGDVDNQERIDGLNDCMQTFAQLWEECDPSEQGMNLISLLKNNPDTADLPTRPMEFLGNILLLIVGGNDTTRSSITGGVLALNENPAEYEKLRADHSLIPSMVSEIIRWQTPLNHMRRTATRDYEFKGQQIKKGDKVVMWYISGNRDETAIENADEFIIDRPNPRRHISFGFGIHRCMGNRLAEMQLRILWEEVMRRFSKIELVAEPVRVQSNFVRGYKSLMVRLHEV